MKPLLKLAAFLLAPLAVIALYGTALQPADPPPPADPAPAGTHRVALNGHTFTLPDGFTIELAAGAGLVPRPVVADFDERGRLYVCDSSGSNEKTAVQAEKKPHRVLRLEDADGDGTFDKQTVFVKNVMFPEGAMWLGGSLYVAAPPHILKFTDTDDDGVADKEEVWFDGKTLTGCANDLHGPYRGPDGMIYWCKGAFAKQEYDLPGGKKFTTRASHIFRATPDGKNIEPVMTGGMDNPVDVVFTPSGERIFSCTFFQHPRDGKRDGLIHAVYGGVYGKDHDPIHEHPWTAPTLMPVLTHMGPAAPCGLHRYESDQFGPAYADNLFCCQFNLRKVSRHVLVPDGSTYRTVDSDFVVSDNRDFHPTDVIEDADGSLLIVDTGGWFKLCCPTSQLVKEDVTGAIYRVRKVGAHKVDDPRGAKIDWAKAASGDLVRWLDDPRPAVQRRATEEIGRRPESTLTALDELFHTSKSVRARRNALWAAARFDLRPRRTAHPDSGLPHALLSAVNLARPGLADPDPSVRRAAAHLVALHRYAGLTADLTALLKSDPPTRRAAAEGLGRLGDPKGVPAILAALADPANDRPLDHSLTYALIEIGSPTAAEGLKSPSPRVRRAALAALDQMPGGKLDPKAVLAELNAADPALKETAWWIAGRHPEWGGELAGMFAEQLKSADNLTPAARDELADRLVKFVSNAAVQTMLGELPLVPHEARQLRLGVMARSGFKELPRSWHRPLVAALAGPDAEASAGFAVLRAVPAREAAFAEIEGAAGERAKWTDDQVVALYAAYPPGRTLPEAAVRHLFPRLAKDAPSDVRGLAVEALSRAKLTRAQFVAVAAALKTVGPLELAKLLPVFAKSTDETVGRALVAALTDPAVRPAVRAEAVKPVLDKYPQAVRAEADKLYALLAEARKGERDRLDKLLADLKPGDVRRGQAVFNGTKAACAACHKIGYVGGLVGPDLTKIGNIRTERDLLEAIVYPSASFVRSYEPYRVVTVDGKAHNGVLKKDAPDEVVLAVAADQEVRVPRADIEEMTPSAVSVMPAGLDGQLTPQELADLVAFLKACK